MTSRSETIRGERERERENIIQAEKISKSNLLAISVNCSLPITIQIIKLEFYIAMVS